MAETTDELLKLKGIGPVLAKRLRDAGLDGFEKIVEAGEAGLGQVRGLNQRAIASIMEQSARLAKPVPENRDERMKHLADRIAVVRGQVEHLAQKTRDRYAAKLSGKSGKKVSDDLIRIVDALERMAGEGKRLKRAEKVLTKAEAKMGALAKTSLKKLRRGLKKTRRTLVDVTR